MSDKMPKLINTVNLTGKVEEVKVKTGNDKNGNIYVSVEGKHRFGENGAMAKHFKTYQGSITSKGKDNGLYPSTLEFANKAKSIIANGYENATNVKMVCSFEPNYYVNSQEKLIEGLQIKPTFFNDVEVSEDNPIEKQMSGQIDIEGRIENIKDEEKNEVATGRKKFTLYSTNYFGDLVVVKNIIVPENLVSAFESGYEEGQTAKFSIDLILHTGESKTVAKEGGMGQSRVVEGKSYAEMVVVGADSPKDESDKGAISDEAFKIAKKDLKVKLDDIKAKGYQGSKTNSGSGGSNRTTGMASGNTQAQNQNSGVNAVESDDDIPF